MKKILQIVIILIFNIHYAQTVFLDDFGTSPSPTAANDYGRKTSPYVPTGSFTYGTSKANSSNYTVTHIDNSCYAVVAPEHIYSGVVTPGYYFWTLPTSTTPNFDGADRYVEDHTPGDTNGAVLVINAQTVNTPFYERNFTFVPGASYEASFWMYVVNPTTQTRLVIKDTNGNDISSGGTLTPINGSKSNSWQEYKLNFTAPSGACTNTVVKLSLQNVQPGGGGNDYYIDDIKVTRLASAPGGTTLNFTCPTVFTSVDSDGDGIPDYADLDYDNDGILDSVENVCETETATPAYSNDFGTGTATTSDSKVVGHNYAPNNPSDGNYTVSRSLTQSLFYTQTNLNANKDAGNPIIENGSDNGRYLMINVAANYTNQVLYRVENITVTTGRKYRFRIDMAGLADNNPHIPNLRIAIKDTSGNILAFGDSNNIGMANDDIWRRLSISFVATNPNIILEIINLQPLGSSGNDVGIDNVVLVPLNICDTDGDGIENSLDLDSDGDGCFDAIEGDENVNTSHLNSNGSINYAANGGIGTAVTNNGVPNIVNSGAFDIGNDVGQGIGVSEDISKNDCLDSDFDGIPNWKDLDDDNDGILDTVEGCSPTVTMGTITSETVNDLKTKDTAVFSLVPPGATLPNNGVKISKLSGGNGWNLFTPVYNGSSTTSVTVNGTQSATFPTTYLDIVNWGNTIGQIPRLLEIDFGVSANSLSTADNDYQYIIGIAGLGGESTSVSSKFSVPLTVVSNSRVFPSTQYSLLDGVVSTTPGQTGTVVSTSSPNNTSQNYTFYFIPKSVKSFTMNVTGGEDPHGFIFGVYNMNCTANTDGDAFPNYLDVDSDGDGCPDAIEGSEFIKYDQVHALNLPATDANYNYKGQIKVLANGTTPGLPSQVVSKTATANGVPELVNPAANNTSGTLGTADNTDIPPSSEVGQGIGSSQDITVNQCVCYDPANKTGGPVLETQHGITSLNRAGTNNGNWPMVRKGAWTALESKTKGFVPNRLTTAQIDAIPANELVEGMMVYNITSDCLQINTTGTAAGWKCFTTQTCPTLN